MRYTESRLSAAISFLLLATHLVLSSPAPAATHPRNGGTLRVEVHAVSVTLDPREWLVGSLEAAGNEKLAELVFERLVALDNYGRFQSVLATEWSHDGANKRWQFTIRAGVRFSDGSMLTAADVAAAIQPLLPGTQQISVSGNSIVIKSRRAGARFAGAAASGRYFVYRVLASGAFVGTGPFVR
jgi:ABC-type transport system substrate-binding protein